MRKIGLARYMQHFEKLVDRKESVKQIINHIYEIIVNWIKGILVNRALFTQEYYRQYHHLCNCISLQHHQFMSQIHPLYNSIFERFNRTIRFVSKDSKKIDETRIDSVYVGQLVTHVS
jgi:hypothetical protein